MRLYSGTRIGELETTGWSDSAKAAFCKMQFELQSRHYSQYYPDIEQYLVIVDDNQVGRLYLEETGSEIRIIDIIIRPEFRSRRIGQRIITAILDDANRKTLAVSLHVEKNNPILKFYLAQGFQIGADRDVYFFLERPPQTPPTNQQVPE
ncbi:MAG: GNAT family N-acetyltransferase [Candidatus Neomarinimicrobiota bacterium]